jgi:hypothetical protein
MARTTHVAKAQQRYETKPVLDEDGQPKRTPVMRDGEQKKTKRGSLVFMTVTERDLTKPLDPYTCDACGKPIEIGTPYKHITPKSGPYGGHKRTRHESCPSWQVWEYSNSLSAQIARIEHDYDQAIDSAESPDDVQSALDDAASSVEEIAGEKRDGASNIEDGFGHPTSQSEELEQMADDLEGWAEEIKSADIPDLPEPEERYFIEGPDGTRHGDDVGYETEDDARDALTGMLEDLIEGTETTEDDFEFVPDTLDEPSEEQIDEWRDEVRNDITIVSECPV